MTRLLLTVRAAKTLSPGQISAIVICTRIMSVFSLMGSCYIISTFILFTFYRKPINRLVFYATWGNIMANVATLISTSGIPKNLQSISPLCEFQGVLIQWFMMADSLWVFCMATNVFLVFWRGYDAQQLRHLEKWYLLLAYGMPAIPPLIYVILDHTKETRILGPATIWCWVAKEVDWMRIAFFYGPVWLIVSATMTIYVATGIKIFRKGALLRYFLHESQQTSGHRDSSLMDEVVSHPFAAGKNIVVTTKIQHDTRPQESDLQCASYEVDQASISSYSSMNVLSKPRHREEVEVTPTDQRLSRFSRDFGPSTANRNGPHSHNEDTMAGYIATVSAAKNSEDSSTLPPRSSSAATQYRNSHIKKAVGNEAALAYLKVAFLMFIALFVVWVPSSGNRLYQFTHKNQPNFALNILSAIVLPLQGAWNATIYIYTTRSEYKRAYYLIKSKFTGKAGPLQSSRTLHRDNISTTSQDREPEIMLEEGLKQGHAPRHFEIPGPTAR